MLLPYASLKKQETLRLLDVKEIDGGYQRPAKMAELSVHLVMGVPVETPPNAGLYALTKRPSGCLA